MSNKLEGIDYVTKRTGWCVYDLVAQGLLPAVRAGRRLYFDPQQLEAWIEQGGRASTSEGVAEPWVSGP